MAGVKNVALTFLPGGITILLTRRFAFAGSAPAAAVLCAFVACGERHELLQ